VRRDAHLLARPLAARLPFKIAFRAFTLDHRDIAPALSGDVVGDGQLCAVIVHAGLLPLAIPVGAARGVDP